MSFNSYILTLFNIDKDFYQSASSYFKEPPQKIEAASLLILRTILVGLDIQKRSFDRSEEIRNMIKEAGTLSFSEPLASGFNNVAIMTKGNGFVSELFGENVSRIITFISAAHDIKPSTGKKIFALLVTFVLHTINDAFSIRSIESMKALHFFILLITEKIALPLPLTKVLNKMLAQNEKREITWAMENV